MAQGESPRNPLAFASVLCPGRCLASQPIHLGSEVGEGQRCKRGRLRPPPQASPGGERQVDGQHHRLCPMALTALCHSAAAVSTMNKAVIFSELNFVVPTLVKKSGPV